MGCGSDLVVSVLALRSDNPSLNPGEHFTFFVNFFFEIMKINKKMSTLAHFSKNICFFSC